MKVQLRPNKQGNLVLFIGNKRYLIKKGLSKKKIVNFVKGKLKPKGKVVYKTFGPGNQSQTQTVNVNALVNEQIERQAERLASQSEADLFRHTRDSLILMAKNAGIKNPYRMTKLQLISAITDLPTSTIVKNIKDAKLEEELVDQGIAIQRGQQARHYTTRLVANEERRLGRKLNDREIALLIDQYETKLEEDSKTLPPMTELDRQLSGDVARGLSPEEIERKYNLNDDSRADEEKAPPQPQVDPSVYGTIPPHLRYQNLRRWMPTGNGRGEPSASHSGVDNGDALTNIQIDKIMKPYGKLWLGSCACDTIQRDILPKVKPGTKGCFIINTDKDSGPGEHWCGAYFDATPKGDHSLEFFDSYGENPDPPIDKGLQAVANKLNCKNYLKYKINSVCWQGKKDGTNKDSSNCGYFAIKFLIDRLRGKSFSDSTGFDASNVGEKNIERFKTGEGIQKEMLGCGAQMGFGILPSFGMPDVPTDLASALFHPIVKNVLFTPSREFSRAFNNIMSKYGHMKIISAKIRRAPIGSGLNFLMNLLSLGKFNQFRRERNFDKFFHLGIVLTLEGGKQLLLEKNAKPSFDESFKDTKDTEYKGPITISGQPTLNQFISKTVDKMGKYGFTNYDALDNNCQKFILSLLEANGSLTPDLKNFIYQDITGIVERLPSYVDKISRFATDTAARAQELIGQGKRRRVTTKRKQAINRLIKSFTNGKI